MKAYKSRMRKLRIVEENSEYQKVKVYNSKITADLARGFFEDSINIYESFFLVLLSRSNTTQGIVKISQGGTAGTVIDVKLIAKYAVNTLSSAVILVHNHPSGNTSPSSADRKITDKIQKALLLLDILVLDHVIVTKDSYYSFADNGIL